MGSNILNLLGILGAAGALGALQVNESLRYFDLPFMLIVALVLLPMARTGRRISRAEGAALICGYGSYAMLLYR